MSEIVYDAVLRCTNLTEGREPVAKENGELSGRTVVRSVSVVLWDREIPADVHTDKKRTAIVTTMEPGEFAGWEEDATYRVTIERVR